jgi:hypothetical protein
MDKQHIINQRLANLHVIYKRQLSATVVIYVGLEYTIFKEHSNYLALYITKTDTGDVVKLKLGTAMKMFNFLADKELLIKARRLSLIEKLRTTKAPASVRNKKGKICA